jgi:hypothetical protein
MVDAVTGVLNVILVPNRFVLFDRVVGLFEYSTKFVYRVACILLIGSFDTTPTIEALIIG